MQQAIHPIVKDLVLVGGGHTHAIALRMFGMKPLPGVRLTLITDTSHTPYSGMLPGHVAGFYNFDECHIDLRRLAGFAQTQLYLDSAIGLDLENSKVICANHPPVSFDYLSIDIGSTSAKLSIQGAEDYAIPAKPVPEFLKAWNNLLEVVTHNPKKSISLAIVGGGAGGVELAMNMQSRLHHVFKNAEQSIDNLKINLIHRGAELLPTYNHWVSRRLQEILLERGIGVYCSQSVCEVLPDKVICESGLVVECDYVFWVTQASASPWIQQSGLKTDSEGFVLVSDTLQSISHPHIFAVGDIATMINHPRPKAGVFAVRQGKPLFQNLRRILLEKPLQTYKPQKLYLSLIGTGDQEAIASWGALGWQSPLLWRWKDYIDRKFMHRFSNLPKMNPESEQLALETQQLSIQTIRNPARAFGLTNERPKIQNPMRCAGCGSKVASTTLERVLQRLQIEHHPAERNDILIGLETPDDAAVVQVPVGQLMVHTIDYFRTLINDPFIFGQISTNHCLSDIFAMGATPQSALAVVTIPYANEDIVEETLYQLLSGAMKVLQQAQTPLVGGHTTEGAELAFGLSCNGLVHPDQLLRKGGMKPGQVLILTKALGTGTLFAADMRYKAKGRWIDQAIESMLLSNQAAAKVFLAHGATACTDITGFGLLGHLLEMIQASGVAVELDLEAIPVLEGAIDTLQMGITSSLQPQNLRASRFISSLPELCLSDRVSVSDALASLRASAVATPGVTVGRGSVLRSKYPLLFDPQTSGGLLTTIPADQAANCITLLKTLGYTHSCVIGQVTSAVEGVKPITIKAA
ncbi:MAG TPA: selenide, water dikinase SelD [Coleofasciculaceae cyanobacterium]|jgi:selenide,water dikinase